MPPLLVRLPNGQTLTVSKVFGGLFFKANALSNSHSAWPAGWTIVLNSDDAVDLADDGGSPAATQRVHRFTEPTLHSDHLYISSISNPSSSDFRPATSPTRQIAMMLWASLYWYFHQPAPAPAAGWRVNVNREGIFKGKVVLPKLERMGLVASEDSSVGVEQSDASPEGWTHMFVSRTAFWQLDPRIYLFTLSPMSQSPFPAGSPYPSRPVSPSGERPPPKDVQLDHGSQGLWSPSAPGPFHSASHLPTYYPPPPPQYVVTDGVAHPLRPKPPRQGEVFYTRFVPSVGQFLSFRVASISAKALQHRGPVSIPKPRHSRHASDSLVAAVAGPSAAMADSEYLHKWMNDARIAHFWGEAGPLSQQEAFLRCALTSRHSIPAIGCWNGMPFGYFELYWAKEDVLGRHVDAVADYDRGFHCLVGEQQFRGAHRVRAWLSALVHYCWLADNRTAAVVCEPSASNDVFTRHCLDAGFALERAVRLPHKEANLLAVRRQAWEAPAL